MDEYLDFVEAAIKDCNPRLAARQKNLEKRITQPFRITPMAVATEAVAAAEQSIKC